MTRDQRPAGALEATLIACMAIVLGVAFYTFARPQPALFLPADWHSPQAHALPALLCAGLPTFVHALAMPLLTAALLQPRKRIGLGAICAAWCVVEIAFEAAQHPRIGPALLAHLLVGEHGHTGPAPLASFVRTGTFDAIDVAAAVLASFTADALLRRPIERRTPAAEACHV